MHIFIITYQIENLSPKLNCFWKNFFIYGFLRTTLTRVFIDAPCKRSRHTRNIFHQKRNDEEYKLEFDDGFKIFSFRYIIIFFFFVFIFLRECISVSKVEEVVGEKYKFASWRMKIFFEYCFKYKYCRGHFVKYDFQSSVNYFALI